MPKGWGFSRLGRVGSGIGQNTGYQVGFASGRSVEIYDRVFLVSYLLSVVLGILGYIGYLLFFWW